MRALIPLAIEQAIEQKGLLSLCEMEGVHT